MSNDIIDLIREEITKKSVPLSELIELKNEMDNAIKILQDEIQENMIEEFRAKSIANGISLEAFGERLMRNILPPIKNKVADKKEAKYKDPNSEKTWNGYGNPPKWFKKWKEDGNNTDDLLINK